MRVRVRGIYATALTELLRGEFDVVQASGPIRERFDDGFGVAPADAAVGTTDDRQGVGITGDQDAVGMLLERARGVARDALAWEDPTPLDAVYDAEVTETLGSGAVVDLGDAEGFLPYSDADAYVEEGDRLRVQVREPTPPWSDDRAVVATRLAATGGIASLVRGGTADATAGRHDPADLADLADLLPTDPPGGWRVEWGTAAEDADMEALDAALAAVVERAKAIEAALAGADAPGERAPAQLVGGPATAWVWFGRESRFALDEHRRAVAPTMPGHHRIKAAAEEAGAAVDFAEAVCEPAGDEEFPFDAVTRQFGPVEGDRIAVGHGKPDGRLVVLGRGEVTDRDPAGTVTLRREMTPGGRYDALGIERRAGDVAITKFKEGRWWYPTAYRGADGERRGTYVNVCTPVEIFPELVRYVDLHVDVVQHADGTVERVDDDELDAAVAAGRVPEALAERARGVAAAVRDALRD